jgi:hypothetical protein
MDNPDVPLAALTSPLGRRKGLQRVQVLTRFALDLAGEKEDPKIIHTPLNVFIAVPPKLKLAQLRSIDLPLLGSITVSAAEVASGLVAAMPYVGDVELVTDLDSRNVAINEIPGGLILRGTVSTARAAFGEQEHPCAPHMLALRSWCMRCAEPLPILKTKHPEHSGAPA